MTFENWDDRAKKVMQLANQEAQRFNHEWIGAEHILLGLVKEGAGVAANVLKNLDVDLRKIRLEVEKFVQSGSEMVTVAKIPYTHSALQCTEWLQREKNRVKNNRVGTEFILIALLLYGGGVVQNVFRNLGLRIEDVFDEIVKLVRHEWFKEPGEYQQYREMLLTASDAPTCLGAVVRNKHTLTAHITALAATDTKAVEISGLKIDELPPEIGMLTKIETLDLRNNGLRSLPGELSQLTQLTRLELQNNALSSPPPEVIQEGCIAILEFLRSIYDSTTVQRFETKLLLLGQGGVGKTSVVGALSGIEFTPRESTEGVDVTKLTVDHPEFDKNQIQLNVWDFAGQEIEHATHQFFMTPNSIYLLVWNARHGYVQGRLDYWLEMIKSRAPEAPIILVATHVDLRAPDINFTALKTAYPQLAGQVSVDNLSGVGAHELLELIRHVAAKLPQMGQRWPENWLSVESCLKKLVMSPQAVVGDLQSVPETPAQALHHIPYNAFADICSAKGITSERSVHLLAVTLHNLGIILHFDDPELKDLVVLQPNWITKAISYALTDEFTRTSFGVLCHDMLPRIWVKYDSTHYSAFWSLMNKFELCYQLENQQQRSLIPALLPYTPPEIPVVIPKLELVYRLSSVPAGVLSRFIVRTHRFNKRSLHWRDGVFLELDQQQGLVQVDENRRELRVHVAGSSPTNFFAVLTDTMDQILQSFPGLEIERWVPCICQGAGNGAGRCKYEFKYRDLVRRLQRERPTIECNESLEDISINQLLYGIHESSNADVLEEVRQVVPLPAENYRQVILLGQRGVIQNYNRLDEIDTRCPSIFTVSRRDGRAFDLRLVCQSAKGWHYASEESIYRFTAQDDVYSILGPLLGETIPLLKHLIPFPGIDVDLKTPISVSTHQAYVRELAHMESFVKYVSPNFGPAEGLKEGLRRLYGLLGTVDKERTYGGLRMTETPDGTRLWLCPFHFGQFQPPPLCVRGFDFETFLCHNRKDKEGVRAIADLLKRRGVTYWLDEEQMLGGDRWQTAMAIGLRRSATVVICVGHLGWGNWQMEELEVALSRSASNGLRTIPLLMPPQTELPGNCPAFLSNRHAIVLATLGDREGFELLVKSIREA